MVADQASDRTVCPYCHMGTWRPRLATYAAWHTTTGSDGSVQDVFIVTPAVPAWVCPNCGARAFDQNVLDRLTLLVGPPAQAPEGESPLDSTRRPETESLKSQLRRAQ